MFIALHGRLGEDGTVQGMCELLGLPYTGSGVLASALCIDKTRTNRLLEAAGLPVPDFEEWEAVEGVEAGVVERLVKTYGLPLVVKPVREGSTIGLTIARDADAVASGLVLAGRYDRRVLVQRFVAGVEITVGVLAAPELQVLPTLEITYENETYDYDATGNLLAVSHYLQALDYQRKVNQVVSILGGKTPNIQNLAVPRKRGDRIRRRAEGADVFVRKLWRLRSHRLRRLHR